MATGRRLVSNDRQIHVEHVFDAPRNRVWQAFTDPDLLSRWWGGATVVDHMDVRSGGSWRFAFGNGSGPKTTFHGDYPEVDVPERIVQTFESSWTPGRVHLETYEFEDLGAQTRMTATLLFDTAEERETSLKFGAEMGANDSYARLDAVLAGLAAED
jgi:uncharacterized protein YndB with AHSA1/START domain